MILAFLKKYRNHLIIGIASLASLFVIFILSVYLGAWGHLPSKKELSDLELDQATEILANDGRLLGKIYINDRQPIPFDSIPEHVVHALVSTEDARFYDHNGVDNRSLVRVFFKSILLQDESSGGGSTITQQLAKNLFPRKDLGALGIAVHKLKESIIAKRLEKVYSKDEILLHYLNTVPFSDNTFGIESAAKHFFNKSTTQLTTAEAATLIGSLKATYSYNPKLFSERSQQRRNVVLSQMEKHDYISEPVYDSLQQDSIKLDIQQYSNNDGIAPYFREHVRLYLKEWLKTYNQKEDTTINIYTDGLKIYTTIDYDMQEMAETSVKEHLQKLQQQFEKSHGKNAPWLTNESLINIELKKTKAYQSLLSDGLNEKQILDSLQQKKEMTVFNWEEKTEEQWSTIDSLKHYLKFLNCGFVAINPKNGALKTWIGGINYEYFKFDHVIQSKRQVGSTFKPFVYTAALENGIDPCTYFSDDAVEYENLKGWTPKNASKEDSTTYMNYSMEYALSNSINTIAVKVLEKTGIQNTIEQAKKMGITSTLPKVPSIALGTAEISLMEMAKAYTSYVNNSVPARPYFIKKIEDNNGNILSEHKNPDIQEEKAFSDTTRELMLEMMKSTINKGTATRLRSAYGLKNDIAGKTGTTQNNKDAWFVGITPELVSVTWVGLDNHKIGFKTTAMGQGANAALPIFGRWMQKMNAKREFGRITQAKFETPSEEILKSLDCAPEKRDGFFKRLFNNPNKKKRKRFKTKASL
ncbi:transglycosylase domain-containing protein [Galbibacter sp. EGI 63066]|uniref:penicillin-binding protein 1A n=1 Tax=Galbibacter sp. EGI 63066 TaxID=2993559 RepID=UPI0022488578|nr:transglycosylase domain-containing protein [Galbibacter sp. EGI 63066]MCX2681357.1 transglycosylase domain-containing protein [Galbibacter sp. EGI 63066]